MKPSSSLVLLFVLSLALPPYIAALDPDLRGDPPAIRASDMEVLPKGDTTSTMAYKAENSVMFEFYLESIGDYDVACLPSGTVTFCAPNDEFDRGLSSDYGL